MTLPSNLNRFGKGMRRPYYCEVEYIQSSGTQYIDTGIIPTINTKTAEKGRILSIGSKTPDFVRWSGNPTYDTFGTYLANPSIVVYYGRYQNNKAKSLPYTVGTDFEIVNDINEIIFNNSVNPVTRDNTGWTNTTYTLYLFAGNNMGNVSFFTDMRMYYYKVWDNGILLRDMIPVLDWNMTACMYDRVSNKLFYNKGTGDFTTGRQIHYVEYLETDGASAIDTLIKPQYNIKLKTKVLVPNIGDDYFSSVRTDSGNTRFYLLNFNTTMGFAVSSANWGGTDFASYKPEDYTGVVHDITTEITSSTISIDVDGNTNSSTVSAITLSTQTLPMFGGKLNDSSTLTNYSPNGTRCYYSQYYLDGVLERDYRPAVDENGIGFMFDKVHHTCYLNTGTGTFKYSDVALEYLESTGTQYINTGLFSTADSNVDVIFSFTSMAQNDSCSIFGGRSSYSYDQNTFSLLKVASSSPQFFRFDCRGQADIAYSNQLTWDSNSKYRFTYGDGEYKISNITTNESISGFMSSPYTFTTYPICIFAINSVGEIGLFMKGRIYEYKYSDGTNTINLKPVMRNGVAGMLDTINNVFYTNQGTGTFNFKIKERK